MGIKKRNIAIIWANPYNKNMGVSALAYSSLAIFNDIFKENQIDGKITFIGSTFSGKDFVTINDQKIFFSTIVGLNYLNWKSFIKILLNIKKYQVYKFFKFDFIFDIAEGDSFSDIYGNRRFYRIFNSKRLFQLIGKKQVLLPQTIGPFRDPIKEKKAIGVMKKMVKVISRDKKSYDYTAHFLPSDKISEMIDVAFYLPYKKIEFSKDTINVGINVSGLLWNGGYTGNNQFNMKADYKKLIIDTIKFFTSMDDVKVHIVPHVIPENSPIEDDYAVGKLIQQDFPDVILAPRFKTPIEAKSYISGLDFFTGARMHACIGAFSSGIPVIPMAYSRKFNGLFVDTLQYDCIGDCVNEDEDVILDKIKLGFANRQELAQKIKSSNITIVTPRLNQLKNILLDILQY